MYMSSGAQLHLSGRYGFQRFFFAGIVAVHTSLRFILYFLVQFRAKRLEKLLDTPAKIYYKYEGVSPAGSHKPNTAVPQVWYNSQEGIKNIVTETGAGQWGSSLAFASSLFGLDCEVSFELTLLS